MGIVAGFLLSSCTLYIWQPRNYVHSKLCNIFIKLLCNFFSPTKVNPLEIWQNYIHEKKSTEKLYLQNLLFSKTDLSEVSYLKVLCAVIAWVAGGQFFPITPTKYLQFHFYLNVNYCVWRYEKIISLKFLSHMYFADQKNTVQKYKNPLFPIIWLYILQITLALGLLWSC